MLLFQVRGLFLLLGIISLAAFTSLCSWRKCCKEKSKCNTKTEFYKLILEEEKNVLDEILRNSAKQKLSQKVNERLNSEQWERCFHAAAELIESSTSPRVHETGENQVNHFCEELHVCWSLLCAFLIYLLTFHLAPPWSKLMTFPSTKSWTVFNAKCLKYAC